MLHWWRSILIFFSCCLTLEASGEYLSFSPSLIQINNRINYLTSNANFDGSGTSTRLPDGNSYKLLDFQSSGRYVMNPHWALLAGLQNSQATSQTGVLQRTNTSLNQLSAGFQYFYPLTQLELIPEVRLINSLDAPATSSDFVPNNEGVFEIIGKTNVQRIYTKYSLFGHGGLNYRGSGRSGLFLWGGGIEGYFGAWAIGTELEGFLTLMADRDRGKLNTNQDDRTSYQNRVAGGSKKFYSYDPSETNMRLFTRYSISRAVVVGFHVGTVLLGTSTASGFYGGLNLNFIFGGASDSIEVTSPREKGFQPRRGVLRTPKDRQDSSSRFRPVQRKSEKGTTPPGNSRSSYQQFQEDVDPANNPNFSSQEDLENFQGEEESKVDQSLFEEPSPTEASPAPGSLRRYQPQEGPVSRRELDPQNQNRRQSARPSIYDPPVDAATDPSARRLDPLKDVRDPRIVPQRELPKSPRFAPRKGRRAPEKFEYSDKPLPAVVPSSKPVRTRSKTRTQLPVFNEDRNIRKQLDEAEMKIELKQKKNTKKKKKN